MSKLYTVSVKRKSGAIKKHYNCSSDFLVFAVEHAATSNRIIKLTIELNTDQGE